ncbi:MAG: GspH/FimT family pseudopilin [Oleibacter sp.]|nr:GspH/FimT family pseudopilin [Thalassolituus sp.]
MNNERRCVRDLNNRHAFSSININQGFTLVELMIAISIAAILLTVGTPYLGSILSSQASKQASSALSNDIELARNLAISKSVIVGLTPAAGGLSDGWRVEQYTNADNDPLTPETVDAGVDAFRIKNARDIGTGIVITSAEFANNTRPILFNATGIPRSAGTITVCSADSNIGDKSIGVFVSGQVVVTPGDC